VQQAVENVAASYFSDSDGYAFRDYGDDKTSWNTLAWTNKSVFFNAIEAETCKEGVEVFYAEPLEDLLEFLLFSPYATNGIILGGSLDVISDAADAISIAQNISYFNYPIFIVDYSQNPTDQQLFKILTNNQTNRIFTASNFTADDVANFLGREAIPLLQSSDCGTVPTPFPV
uniref:Uncharacterized protein n=1 Tax=Panagrolaimus sp. JU765 TaxID=591449 RepID=A0AC34Q9P5_9BILA